MMSQNSKKHTEACRFCWMCRHLCPVGLTTGREVNTPRAKALLLSMVDRGEKFDKDIAQAMYECVLCGSCTNDCVTGFDPTIFIREARTMAAVEDLLPKAVEEIITNISNTGNIYGVQKPKYTGTAAKAEVLLYIGEVAACKQPTLVTAIMSLLKKADIPFTVLEEEPASATFLGDLIGFVEEVRIQAKDCANAINTSGAKTVVVLDSYEATTMKQRYPEWNCTINADVVTATSFIAGLIEEGKLVPKKITGEVTYHDDSRLARDLDEHEPVRNIIKAMGLNLQEMFLNRRMAKCCGSELLKAYAPELAALTAEGRWEDVNRTTADTLVVVSPQVMNVMGAKVPSAKQIKDLYVLLDQAC
ncbi:MAG: Fe-S oxidoreductase [Herbinix sp.]|jgi:Fe-S oxidoreductase|nr:Fe-S oxidoreductase [Herbinix sp.]